MESILDLLFKKIQNNWDLTMKQSKLDFDEMEKKARCVYFVGESIKSKYCNQLGNVVVEVFLDLSESIVLTSQSQYRSAYKALRSALELTVAAVYFIDHPIEFKLWCKDKFDFQFSKYSKEVLELDYTEALDSDVYPNLKLIQELYHKLSQYVHGKYEFLTIENNPIYEHDQKKVDAFFEAFNNTFETVLLLFKYRFNTNLLEAQSKYPYLINHI